MNVSVLDFNAVGDGITNDTIAFNEAILYAHNNGGGMVIAPENHKYIVGYIRLLSNVTLVVEKNAIIEATSNLNEFYNINSKRDTKINVPTWENCWYDGKPSMFFIFANNEENVGITGEGIIDGNEKIFYGNVTKWHIEGSFYPRVPLVYFENCKNVNISNITMQNSAFWTTHLVGCNGVFIRNITINNNLRMTNSDGIDPDHCQNVLIENTNISAADDCIVLKTTEANKKYGDTKNIVVKNCKLTSTSAAIKIGSESVSNFENIMFENIIIDKSNRGISIQLRDCGNVKNAIFKNIKINTRRFSPLHWWGRAEAIALTAVRRISSTRIGSINNVKFDSINTSGENGILIYGENNNIENIKFNDVFVNLEKHTSWPTNDIDLRPSELNNIESHEHIIYARNAKDIELNDFNYNANGFDYDDLIDIK